MASGYEGPEAGSFCDGEHSGGLNETGMLIALSGADAYISSVSRHLVCA